jgi:sigma-E factor negative regulatory protein RseC
MLETRAIVVHVYGKEALVETKGGAGCGNCDSENGCGSSKLTQMFCSKPRQFKVNNEANAAVGDEVQITLPDGVLLRSSMLMYVVPLSLLLSGGMVGAHWAIDAASRDGYAALGSLFGLIGGFVLAKWLANRQRVAAVALPIAKSESV